MLLFGDQGIWKLVFRFEGAEWNVGWINDTLGTLFFRILELGFGTTSDIYIVAVTLLLRI